jgi:putative hydrolase of the HAD superfamily
MKHYSNITTLIFDFGGVIINLDIDKCILNLKQLGVENAELYLSNFGQKDFFLQFEKGQIGVEEFRNEIRNLVAKPLTDRQIDEAWCSFLCDIPPKKLEIILALKKKFRILLLSNTNPLHIEVSAAGEFAKTGKKMTHYFDKCYLSYEMKMAKPNADIFQALLVNEQVAAHQCLFLDDGTKNIEQAEKLGFQTYLVDVNEDLSFLLTNVEGEV